MSPSPSPAAEPSASLDIGQPRAAGVAIHVRQFIFAFLRASAIALPNWGAGSRRLAGRNFCASDDFGIVFGPDPPDTTARAARIWYKRRASDPVAKKLSKTAAAQLRKA